MMMESNNREEYSKSSSEEETDQSNDDHSLTGRSYDCVFCKRGFTTAQALGGHMNVHRKDRAKNRTISDNNSVAIPSLSSQVDDDNNDEPAFRPSYCPIQSNRPRHHYHDQEVHTNYQTFFPEISWGLRSSHAHLHVDDGDESLVQYPHQYLNLFGEDPCGNLSLRIGSSGVYDNKSKRGEDELDLELRLGHDP